MDNEKFTKDGIFNHQLTIHTYDSFGRAIVYSALEKAKEIVMNSDAETDKVSFEVTIRVEKWGNTKCHKVGHGNHWIQVQESNN